MGSQQRGMLLRGVWGLWLEKKAAPRGPSSMFSPIVSLPKCHPDPSLFLLYNSSEREIFEQSRIDDVLQVFASILGPGDLHP